MEFEQIYTTYFRDVYRYIRRLSGSEQIAEEITSETFFKAMHASNSFRGDCDVRVWLCQIAKNCYYSYRKKAGRTELLDLTALEEPGASLEERFFQHDTAMRIQEILHALAEPYKEVFMWRVYAELSFQQIGQIFGKSENWACVTYHRARKAIQNRLEEIGHET